MNKQDIINTVNYMNIDFDDINDASDLYEALDYSGAMHELIDGCIDIYYYELRKWSVDNYEYIDDAIEEGLCKGSDFHKTIQAGQYIYYSEQAREIVEEYFDEIDAEVVS